MGVLTLPGARRRGHAHQLVQAMAVSALAAGLQPQYRCQLDNTGSIITAERSGLHAFGDRDIILAAGQGRQCTTRKQHEIDGHRRQQGPGSGVR